jgi:hypothetical protein
MFMDFEHIKGIKLIQFYNPKRNKTQYCLIEDYSFWYQGREYIVPAGYVTDFASVPTWLWSFFRPTGKHDAADLEHDYLYDHQISTRKDVDRFFYQRMLECGLSEINARCRYYAVRMGGRSWWDS